MYHRIYGMLHKSFNGDDEAYQYDEAYDEDDDALDEPVDETERLRGQITEAIGDEGLAEEYMGSGQELLDDLIANPDPERLSAVLDSEIAELRRLLPDTDIDFDTLKTEAMKAYTDAVSAGEQPQNAIMKALSAIKNALARLVRPLLGRGGGPSRPATY